MRALSTSPFSSSFSLLAIRNAPVLVLRGFLLLAASILVTPVLTATKSIILVDSAVIGNPTVLVVAVLSPGGNSKSAQEISAAVFGKDDNGDGGAINSVKSFYNTCSHGKLNLAKTQDRQGMDISIQNGKKRFGCDIVVAHSLFGVLMVLYTPGAEDIITHKVLSYISNLCYPPRRTTIISISRSHNCISGGANWWNVGRL